MKVKLGDVTFIRKEKMENFLRYNLARVKIRAGRAIIWRQKMYAKALSMSW